MIMQWISLFSILAVIAVHQCKKAEPRITCLDEDIDPCDPEHHQILNDTTRSAGYVNHAQITFSDDYMLLPGWYRSTSLAGSNIPNQPPLNFHCNAYCPMWMKGKYPNANGRIVMRTICVRHYTGKCIRSHEICVKNCGAFNVFYLYTPEGASDRYCFEIDQEDKNTEPKITYKITETEIGGGRCMDYVVYQCNQDGLDTADIVTVHWSINGRIIGKAETLPVSSLPSELNTKDIIASKLVETYGFQVSCTIKTPNKEGQPFEKTANFFAGYKVNRTVIITEEGGQPGYYEIDFTVPCTCSHTCGKPSECDIPVNIEVPKKEDIEPMYDYNPYENQCVPQFNKDNEIVFEKVKSKRDGEDCTSTIKMSTTQGSEMYMLPVYARLDGRYDGDKIMALQLSTASQLDDQLCESIAFPRAQVEVVDKDEDIKAKACHLYNVDHLQTFDGSYFKMQSSGFFIMYQHKTLPIEVQGYVKDFGHYSIVCGVAVRSGGELYVVHYCGKKGFYNKMYQCEQIHEGAKQIKIIEYGGSQKILLPTGGVVFVNKNRITIQPSLADLEKTKGLCGNLNTNNDAFVLKGPKASPNLLLSDSWRVDEEKSLFFGKIYDRRSRRFGDILFCDCDKSDQATCGYTQKIEYCISSEERERDLSYRLRRHCSMVKRQSEIYSDDTDDVDDMVFEYDKDFTPTDAVWQNDWDNDKANKFCEDYIYNSTSAKLCKDITGVDLEKSVEDCVNDIHVTGSTEYAKVHLDLIASTCISEIKKNDTMSKTMMSEGKSISLSEHLLSQLCPSDCNGNGVCVNGECVCNGTYIGNDCSVDSFARPVLKPLPFQGQCDKQKRPCKATAVHGDMFVETDKLMCRVQERKINILETMSDTTKYNEEFQYFSAQFEDFQKVICPLPSHKGHPYNISIAVSHDNHTYSEPKNMLVFDSACWDCDLNHVCTLKADKCEINNECIQHGESHPTDTNKKCYPEKSKFQWLPDNIKSSGRETARRTIAHHFISFIGAALLLFSAMAIM